MFRSILCAVAASLTLILSATEYTSPALSSPDAWSMVVVPDVQFYIKMRRNHGIVDLMNTWIADNFAISPSTRHLECPQRIHF
jgi:hypothetical protein